MFIEVFKSRLLIDAVALPLLLVMLFISINGWNRQTAVSVPGNDGQSTISVEELKKALAQERQSLLNREREQATLRTEVIKRRKLFQNGQLSKDQVTEAERAFVAALTQVHELRHSVTETEVAITEAVLGEKVLRLPVLPVGGFSQTAEFMRFNGGFKWSIREAPRVEKFFAQTFGRRLPVTALGQSHTHSRLGFDHHDSMDVALHPDSAEGRKLIDYLRKAGIPFIAFKQAIPGVSTGPHIHIGKPSGRIAH